ncbi:MAG: bifunctional phosphoribosylaminoimidazolecarboxamide formyltransferase/IMP cyclohydrolase [Phycisphaeraceae bacterium]|nr:bifunctional phosphoribosylaminoimidazolecarboxamide formyltransferase/IMP cyclohydrolase [Phycisphaerales bacterium]MCB9861034.1 bifunctional phosphoribosylaminoimidazolecarboxamide formyltransferase/IMP cyclohydrolase [Phycisphaeraceae bacterium]
MATHTSTVSSSGSHVHTSASTNLVKVKRALLSVSDKAGLVDFARELISMGVELISTGGTAKTIADAGLKVTSVDDVTGFPEMMDGRVKTLHPKIHGGLLAVRDDASHAQAMKDHDIEAIDLVCINLYPFEQTIAKPNVAWDDAIEQIDIGGPSMVRSAAKNHRYVAIVTEPAQYETVLDSLKQHHGSTTHELRRKLALAAFERTASYDAAISRWMGSQVRGTETDAAHLPERITLTYTKSGTLRYGENPHQTASLYHDPQATGPSVVGATQLYGKELSYNNLNDASASLELALALHAHSPKRAGAVVVKHTNPCGCALHEQVSVAVDRAIACDPLAAYGGILAVNTELDDLTATRLCENDVFLEVVIAPSFDEDAVERLKARWKNIRLLETGTIDHTRSHVDFRFLPGGMLAQDSDRVVPDPASWEHKAGPIPDAEQLAAAAFLQTVGRALSSNAVCIGGWDENSVRLFGAGAGQMDRVASCRIAVEKAGELAQGAIAFSDAFFPFNDGPQVLIDAGVKMIVHPGGSKRDQDTFDLCAQQGVVCMTTGIRHFRH